MPRSRGKRLKEAKRRLDEELWTEMRANRAYEHYRSGRMKDGRRFSRPPDPYTPPATPQGQINITDPDSHVVKGSRGRGFLQGYNAQAVANEHQIVIAAEVMTVAPDFGHLEPMLDAAQRELDAAGVTRGSAGARRGRRLLASAADGADRRSRHPGADPARRQEPQRHAAGLGRRPLRVHAQSPRQRPRRRALRPAPSDHRAGLCQHEVQPRHRPLPTTRPSRRPQPNGA